LTRSGNSHLDGAHELHEPERVVIGGPNGAGKSTAAPAILRDTITVSEFVNADVIARGLSGFNPQGAGIAAGRIMLERLAELASSKADFAFESTLASRSLARWLRGLAGGGYLVHVVFLWLPSVELAVARVRDRERLGGHSVPYETIVRRYARGAQNFLKLYRPLATTWRVYDNSPSNGPILVARSVAGSAEVVLDADAWKRIQLSWRELEAAQDDPRDPF
jgi:predicted ABC-type ATPase